MALIDVGARVTELAVAGADALVERGRAEVRAEYARQLEAEARLDGEVRARVLNEPESYRYVSVIWLLKEALRRSMNGSAYSTISSTSAGVFACALSGLTSDQVTDCAEFVRRMRASNV